MDNTITFVMENPTVKVLESVKEILSDQTKWTKNAFARNTNGYNTSTVSEDAVCWCLEGAVVKAVKELDYSLHDQSALYFLNRNLPEGYRGIFSFNDDPLTKFPQVQEVIENALEEAIGQLSR